MPRIPCDRDPKALNGDAVHTFQNPGTSFQPFRFYTLVGFSLLYTVVGSVVGWCGQETVSHGRFVLQDGIIVLITTARAGFGDKAVSKQCGREKWASESSQPPEMCLSQLSIMSRLKACELQRVTA